MRKPRLVTTFWTTLLAAAQTLLPGEVVVTPPSPVIVYGAFFRQIVQLEGIAGELDAQGRNGAELRAYVKSATGLTEPQVKLLKTVAVACDAALRQKDAQAQALIREIRSRTPGGRLKSRSELPQVPRELLQLQSEHDAIVQSHIASLETVLGPAAFQRLHEYVTQSFAKGITLRHLPPGQPAAGGANPALHQTEGGIR